MDKASASYPHGAKGRRVAPRLFHSFISNREEKEDDGTRALKEDGWMEIRPLIARREREMDRGQGHPHLLVVRLKKKKKKWGATQDWKRETNRFEIATRLNG